MADEEAENDNESSTSDEIEIYDPRLDFFSDKFDPLLALKTRNLKIPDANAKKYDNLACYQSAVNREENPQLQQQSSKKKQTAEVVEVKRKWLPHQLPVRATNSKHVKKTIFTRMEAMKGPLAVLKNCMDQRLRIKICTRHQRGIRGYCLAYVVAFDKHWNMALEEVVEFWTRPKKRKVPALDSAEENEEVTRRVRPPKIKISPHESDKKLENCTRNVPQLMLRGEHVVFVNVLNEEKEATTTKT